MRYGSSGNLTATQPNKTGIETIEKLKKFGYDYIELPLSEIMDLPPEQREAIVTRVEASGIKSEVLNNLFPRRMKLTGPNIDRKAVAPLPSPIRWALIKIARSSNSTACIGSLTTISRASGCAS